MPLIDDNGKLKGLITNKDIEKITIYPHRATDTKGRLLVAAAVGIGGDMEERVAALVKSGVDALGLDSAHGHSANIIKALKHIKSNYPETQVIAGHVSTVATALGLIETGAHEVNGATRRG